MTTGEVFALFIAGVSSLFALGAHVVDLPIHGTVTHCAAIVVDAVTSCASS